MKRLGCLLLSFAILPVSASAQLRSGFEVGVRNAWTHYPEELDVWDTQSRVDFNGAIHFEWGLNEQWALGCGLRYSRLGNEVDIQGLPPIVDPGAPPNLESFEISQEYLGIPWLARWNFLKREGPYVIAGAETAWLIAAHQLLRPAPGGTNPEQESEPSIRDDMNAFNFTLIGGVGYSFPVGDRSVEIGVRYAHGLVGTADEDKWISSWRTRELALTLGLKL